jgi:hypothetical protein
MDWTIVRWASVADAFSVLCMTRHDTNGDCERQTSDSGAIAGPSRIYHDLRTRNERRARVAQVREVIRSDRGSHHTVRPLWWRRESQ